MGIKLIYQGLRFVVLSTVVLTLASSSALVAQGKKKVSYSIKEYQVYNAAVSIKDLGKREDAILGYLKTKPNKELYKFALNNYLALIQGYQKQGNFQGVLTAGGKLVQVEPNNMSALSSSLDAAYRLKKHQQVITYGEKVYATKPSAGISYALANAFLSTNQNAKFLIYAPKACEQLQPKDTYALLAKLTGIHVERKKWGQASKYGKQALEGFKTAKKGETTSQSEWDKYVKRQRAIAHAAIARNAAERRNWGGAIANYNQALRADSWAGLRGEAFYYIGMGRWRQGQIDAAMKAFGRGSKQRGAPHAKPCRQFLEELYKSTHNDSLAGIEEFVAQL